MTRSFAAEPIDIEALVALIDLARRAPSAGFSQGTHFLILAGDVTPEEAKTLAEKYYGPASQVVPEFVEKLLKGLKAGSIA